MALPFLIGYHRLLQGEDPATIYAQYTCPNDGYVHAWGDATDPTIIWLLPTCPVDAVHTNLVTNIGNFVNSAYNYQTDADPHVRILAIIAKVKDECKRWLNQNTTASIASFLSDDLLLEKLIFANLLSTGAVS